MNLENPQYNKGIEKSPTVNNLQDYVIGLVPSAYKERYTVKTMSGAVDIITVPLHPETLIQA